MADQFTFDRAEDIAQALHEQDALDGILISLIGDKLPPEDERTIFGLIHAQMHCRRRAEHAAREIARGAPVA